MNIIKRIKTLWNWYVRGYYHCDHCPYCWEERGMEDSDAGCYIYGDIRDTCRLPFPIRGIVGSIKRNRACFYTDRFADEEAQYYTDRHTRLVKMTELIDDFLPKYLECRKNALNDGDDNTSIDDVCPEWCFSYIETIVYEYEKECHPETNRVPCPLRIEWKRLLSKTWKEIIVNPIRSIFYNPKKKRKAMDL